MIRRPISMFRIIQIKQVKFSADFETESLPDLKRRYEAGERPNYAAYLAIHARSTPDKLEVFRWLLSTDFEDPSLDFWVFVANDNMWMEYVDAVTQTRQRIDCKHLACHAIHHCDKKLMEFAASHMGWKMEYLFEIDIAMLGQGVPDVFREFRAWFLKKSGHVEDSYVRWAKDLPYEKLV